MGVKRYIKDYRNEYIIKPDGKPGVKAVYIGRYYKYKADDGALRVTKLLFLVCTALSAICAVAPLCYNHTGAHIMYAVVPNVLALFPLAYLVTGVFNLFYCRVPLINEFKDKGAERIRRSSAGGLVLCALASLTQLYCLIVEGFDMAGTVALALLVVSTASVSFIFFRRADVAVVECDGPEEDDGL